jgi:hypothetical protein
VLAEHALRLTLPIDSLARGSARVRALLFLSEGAYHDNHRHEHLLERALAESGEDPPGKLATDTRVASSPNGR